MDHIHKRDSWGLGAKLAAFSFEQRAANAQRRMAIVDALPLEWRLFVHEHGLKNAEEAIRVGYSPARMEAHINECREKRLRAAEFESLLDSVIL